MGEVDNSGEVGRNERGAGRGGYNEREILSFEFNRMLGLGLGVGSRNQDINAKKTGIDLKNDLFLSPR